MLAVLRGSLARLEQADQSLLHAGLVPYVVGAVSYHTTLGRGIPLVLPVLNLFQL